MENEEKLNIATKTILAQVQSTTTVTFDQSNGKITKVLTISAKPTINSVQVEQGQVKFEGETTFNAVVVLEDSQIVPLSQASTFTQIVENDMVKAGDIVLVSPSVQEITSSFANGELQASCTNNFNLSAINQNKDLSCAKAPEGVFTREEEVCFSTLANANNHEFFVTFNLNKDSKVNKILLFKNMATIKSVVPANDYFVVSGEVYSTIVYQSEDLSIKSMSKETPFSEEVASQGTNKDSIIQAFVSSKTCSFEENDSTFNMSATLIISSQSFNKQTASCVTDAYSLKYDVNLTTTSFNQDEFCTIRQAEENLLTSSTLDSSLPRIDRILATTPTNITILNQIVKDNEILLEGIASFNLIYYSEDDDGNKILNSVDVDLPYSTLFAVVDVKSNFYATSQVVIGDINVKSKRGRELEILVELKANFNIYQSQVGAITTQITLGEEKPCKDYALEIYLTRDGDTLWDIAKKLNISTSDLIAQNGELSFPLPANEKIVAYNKLSE